MNIGIVTTWFERGAAYVSRAYMNALARDHQVYIYARGGEQYAVGDPQWDLPNVTWGKRIHPAYGTNLDWPDFERWVQSRALDVVIFNEQQHWRPILQCQKLRVVIGAYVDYYTRETAPFFALYDFLLCNTQRHFSVFQDHPQAFFLPWGTDCQLFRPSGHPIDRQSLAFFHSAGMGGVNLRKGTDVVVKAFVKASGAARLIVHSQVGLDQYGDIASLIQQDRRIEFIHATVTAPGLYHLGDVYVYPTRLEGIGLTIAEALACGLPVITTDEAPMNEFVVDGVTGALLPVVEQRQRADGYYWPESIASEDALTATLQRYIDVPELVEQQSQQARRYAVSQLDWAQNSRNLTQMVGALQRRRSQSWLLRRAVLRYEQRVHPTSHIEKMFLNYEHGQPAAARRHFLQGILSEPEHWSNRGVWSIGSELLIGKQRSSTLRRLLGSGRGSA